MTREAGLGSRVPYPIRPLVPINHTVSVDVKQHHDRRRRSSNLKPLMLEALLTGTINPCGH